MKKIIMLIIALAIFTSISFISAEANYCCEKTTSGAWCQNAPAEQCDANFKKSPTSCDSTSYCKRGCCFDSGEGLCLENTPQKVCEDSQGTWSDNAECNIMQCNLGCCILADQGAFVTLTRCKQLATFYNLKIDFRRNIDNEVTCISTAQKEDKGACVSYNPELGKNTCKFTTRGSCIETESVITISNSSLGNTSGIASEGFYKDILCTAEELGTECAKQTKTTLIEGKDEVYFTDTCGNIANIYDSQRFNDNLYWKKVFKKSESCGPESSNAGSVSCGNCDYFKGSIGKKATTLKKPTYGDNICVDLGCKEQNKRHGESWCITDSPSGDGKDTVGSRYFKEVCLNGEVLTEPCDDYRGQICIEGKFNGFSEAACRVNRWQDCLKQEEKADCENADQRDCFWRDGYYYSANSAQIEKSNNDTDKGPLTPKGICLPEHPPGFPFWGSGESASLGTTTTTGNQTFGAQTPQFNAQTPAFGTGYVDPTKSTGVTSASEMCAMGNAKITFQWKKVTRLWPFKSEGWECNNDECRKYDDDPEKSEISDGEADAWAEDMNEFCYSLGDCGGYINWVGKETKDGYAAYLDGERVSGAGGAEILEKPSQNATTGGAFTNPTGTTGMVISIIKNMFGEA